MLFAQLLSYLPLASSDSAEIDSVPFVHTPKHDILGFYLRLLAAQGHNRPRACRTPFGGCVEALLDLEYIGGLAPSVPLTVNTNPQGHRSGTMSFPCHLHNLRIRQSHMRAHN